DSSRGRIQTARQEFARRDVHGHAGDRARQPDHSHSVETLSDHESRKKVTPGICLIYARCMPDVCQMYARCIPDVCQMYARCMPDVCQMYARCMNDRVIEYRRAQVTVTTDRNLIPVDAAFGLLKTTHWAADLSLEILERAMENSICFGALRSRDLV